MPDPTPTSLLQQRDPSTDDPVLDAKLMAEVKLGDKAAFSELYDRHSARVYGICLRVLRLQSEAEAVVSNVFWEIWRKPEGFDPLRGSCSTYLFTLARSRAIDRLRASKTRVQKNQAAMHESQRRQESQEPYEAVLASERQQVVRVALENIDREQRDALTLAYFEGLTHREISDQLEKPLGTIKTHIRRGLQSLKAALKSIGGQDEV